MTARSRAQVDKETHIRRLGGKVPVGGLDPQRKIPIRKPRSTAQVDKDAHIRALGGKVAPRGKASDAASGRGIHSAAAKRASVGTKSLSEFKAALHPRNRKGEFRSK
jgi:hypothetical protein